jgi:hypothetical protein
MVIGVSSKCLADRFSNIQNNFIEEGLDNKSLFKTYAEQPFDHCVAGL